MPVNIHVAIPVRTSVLRLSYEVLDAPFPSRSILPAKPVILYTAYHPITDVLPFFILVKPDRISGVVLANTCEVYETTLLVSLWPNISTQRATVFQFHVTNLERKQSEMKLIFHLGTVQPDGLNINFNFKSDLMHARALIHLRASF